MNIRFGWRGFRRWWLLPFLALAGCGAHLAIGYNCHPEARQAPPTRNPFYLQDVCRRLICDSPTRLPSDATVTGRCN